MKNYVPFKLWGTEDKIAFIGGIAIYLTLIISGICMINDFVVAGILFWGGVIGAIIHAYLTSKLHIRDI